MSELEGLGSGVSSDFESSSRMNGIGDEEFLEISTLSIPLKNYPLRGFTVELEVMSQNDNTVTVLVSSTQGILLDALKPGTRFPQIEFCSPVAVFRSPCFVSRVSKQESDSEKETYVIHITIECT